jgi:alkylation response protein AidB-like acyl-CoA dehydrogenase
MKISARYQFADAARSVERCEGLLAWMRDYAERRIDSRLIDERRSIPPHVVLDWGNAGLLGIQVEERHGGLALRHREVVRILEQAAALDLGVGTWLLVCLYPGVRPLAAFGGEALRDELLPDLARGRILAGYAQTEPGAGTHFQGMAARAVAAAGDGWCVSGDKVWIGNAHWSGVLTVIANAVDRGGARRGLSAFAVRTDAPGVALGGELVSMGLRGMVQSEVSFRGVAVDAAHVVGGLGRGLDVGVDSMSYSRFAIAATCIGTIKRCAQLMLRFASRRAIATGRLLEHPVALVALSDAVARADLADGLLYRVADRLDAGDEVPLELFAACKVIASEFAWRTADDLVQLLGSRGYDEANLAPQILRDARVARIFEGTSEALLAFLGANASGPRSEIGEFLRSLGAERIRCELEAALAELAQRAWPERLAPRAASARAWQANLAGRAALWALLAAIGDADRGQRATGESAARWARRGFDELLAAVGDGPDRSDAVLEPADLEKSVARFAAEIGDVAQRQQWGERRGVDPILRRDPG